MEKSIYYLFYYYKFLLLNNIKLNMTFSFWQTKNHDFPKYWQPNLRIFGKIKMKRVRDIFFLKCYVPPGRKRSLLFLYLLISGYPG